MNLSVLHTSAYSGSALDMANVTLAELKMNQDNAEMQAKSYEANQTVANANTQAIINSFNDEADSTRTQGQAEVTGSIVNGATTLGGQSGSLGMELKVSSINDQMSNVEKFSDMLAKPTVPAGGIHSEAAGEEASREPIEIANKFNNGSHEDLESVFSNVKPDDMDNLVIGVQGDKTAAKVKADAHYKNLKTRQANYKRASERLSSVTGSSGQIAAGLVRGFGQMQAADSTADRGKEEATKSLMTMTLELFKGIRDVTSGNMNAAQQVLSQVYQTLGALARDNRA